MIKIGTRKSPLALVQAELVRQALIDKGGVDPEQIQIVPMSTTGDEITDRRLMLIGGKGLFTKEIEDALLRGDVDLAVHSMKDVATQLPDGLIIPCFLPRNDVRDVWISPKAGHPKDLAPGSRVGTSSLRRAAQTLHLNPNVEIVTLRGNVQTRLRKIHEGEADGTLLAMAGLQRLNMEHEATYIMGIDEMVPAPAQGAIAIQCRENDDRALGVLALLNHEDTFACVEVERAFLENLDGSCRTPIAAVAVLKEGVCHFTGLIASPEGRLILREEIVGPIGLAKAQAKALAVKWLNEYGSEIFKENIS